MPEKEQRCSRVRSNCHQARGSRQCRCRHRWSQCRLDRLGSSHPPCFARRFRWMGSCHGRWGACCSRSGRKFRRRCRLIHRCHSSQADRSSQSRSPNHLAWARGTALLNRHRRSRQDPPGADQNRRGPGEGRPHNDLGARGKLNGVLRIGHADVRPCPETRRARPSSHGRPKSFVFTYLTAVESEAGTHPTLTRGDPKRVPTFPTQPRETVNRASEPRKARPRRRPGVGACRRFTLSLTLTGPPRPH